jgi:acetyl-CoA carboxylase carboxyltransferase component
MVYAWKNASIGMMDAVPAVKIMYAKEIAESQNAGALISEMAAEYQAMQASAVAAARRGYVDDIIAPEETRQKIAAALQMLGWKSVYRPDKKNGTV